MPTYRSDMSDLSTWQLPEFAECMVKRIEHELADRYPYHCGPHTRAVIGNALLLATTDGLPERTHLLLSVAAAFHDAGFLLSPTSHEQQGATWAKAAMQAAGDYSPDEIALVQQLIFDTRLQQTACGMQQIPSTSLSEYLLDADLANLGNETFFAQSELIRKEQGRTDREAFYQEVHALFVAHRWYTKAAVRLWQRGKEQNLSKLKERLDQSKRRVVSRGGRG